MSELGEDPRRKRMNEFKNNVIAAIYIGIMLFSGGFAYAAGAPGVSTDQATLVRHSSAMLNATVSPGGEPVTYFFYYGTNSSCGQFAGNNKTSPNHVGSGHASLPVSVYVGGLEPSTRYYFCAVAENGGGTTHGSVQSFITTSYAGYSNGSTSGAGPTVTTNTPLVSGASVTFYGMANPQGSATDAWFEYGPTQSLGTTIGSRPMGSDFSNQTYTHTVNNLLSGGTYYYRAAARNERGTAYGAIVQFTAGFGQPTVLGAYTAAGSAPAVTTIAASSIDATSAVLKGEAVSRDADANAWLEWGTSGSSFAFRSPSEQVRAATGLKAYSFSAAGLQPGTRYFYRAAAQNAYGTAYGTVYTFVTAGTVPAPAPVPTSAPSPKPAPKPTVLGAADSKLKGVILTGSVSSETPRPGSELIYTLVYINASGAKITDAEIETILPSCFFEARLDELGPDTVEANRVLFKIGTLEDGAQGVISIAGTVPADAEIGTTLFFAATLNYRDAAGNGKSVSSYTEARIGEPEDAAAAGAATERKSGFAALFGSLGANLLWILLGILFAALFFFVYRMFDRKRKKELEAIQAVR